MSINVLVPLAQGCEELEAVTVIDLLRRAKVNVVTAGLDANTVKASRGVNLVPDTTLDDALTQSFDMMVLPGGLPGADYLNQDPRIQQLLQQMSADGKYTAAICAAPKVLASAGLLSGKQATSFPGVLTALNQQDIDIQETAVCQDGTIITSRGPGTAIDFALTLIELLVGSDIRNEVEDGLKR